MSAGPPGIVPAIVANELEALRARVRAAFEPRLRDGGARFDGPVHIRVLARRASP